TFKLPLLVGQASPLVIHNVRRGRLTYHRGWRCVAANLHTPLSPLFRGESQKIEIPKHKFRFLDSARNDVTLNKVEM
ncbi:MAG: hypothetical protein KGI30_05035, partial [Planctomycetota bacterium]|nr:hypothetical protein [Planctomycetota bacterium]